MRRTPYTERGYRQTHHINMKETGDFLVHTANKSDINYKQSHNVNAYLQAKNSKPYHLQYKNTRSNSRRPLSVNRSNSGVKSRSKIPFI